jgi:hypothetical protein
MLAKNKRLAAIPNIHANMAARAQATCLAYEWVTKFIALRGTGKSTQAKAAEQKARHWLKKAIALETRGAGSPRIGGRA